MRASRTAAILFLAFAGTIHADIIGEADEEPAEPGTSTAQIEPIKQVDDDSYSGYLTDIYCWDLRIALDGADMLLQPERHTVHCLRDIPECIDSGYGVLGLKESGTEYELKYRFDEAGNKAVLNYVGTTDKRNNVIVTVRGKFKGNTVKVTSLEEYVAPGSQEDVGVRGEAVLFVHLSLMCLAFGALFPWGVALARGGKKLGGDNPWLMAHRALQVSGWVVQLAGVACAVAFADSRNAHFTSVHTWVGIAVVGLTTLQPFGAIMRPHAAAPGEEKTSARSTWELAHKIAGYVIVVMGLVTIGLGIAQLFALGYDPVTINTAISIAVIAAAPPIIYYYLAAVGEGNWLTQKLLSPWGEVHADAAPGSSSATAGAKPKEAVPTSGSV